MSQPPPPPVPPPVPPPADPPPGRAKRGGPAWLWALIAVLVLVLVAGGVTVGLVVSGGGDDTAAAGDRSSSAGSTTTTATATTRGVVTDAERRDALAAAQHALPVVLSYSYRSFDRDVASATALMSDSYAVRYRRTTANFKSTVLHQRATVRARVRAVGLSGLDADAALVVAFADQVTTRGGGPSTTIHSPVKVLLVHDAGKWVVQELGMQGSLSQPVPAEPDAARSVAMAAASWLVKRMGTVSYRSVDDDLDAAEKLMTGHLLSSFHSSRSDITAVVRRASTSTTATIDGTGLAEFDGTRAKAVVAAVLRHKAPGRSTTTEVERAVVDLVLVNGAWLAEDLHSVS